MQSSQENISSDGPRESNSLVLSREKIIYILESCLVYFASSVLCLSSYPSISQSPSVSFHISSTHNPIISFFIPRSKNHQKWSSSLLLLPFSPLLLGKNSKNHGLKRRVFSPFDYSVLAGENCKCQAADGQGPQWNDLTSQCCDQLTCGKAPIVGSLVPTGSHYPGPNHQVSLYALCFFQLDLLTILTKQCSAAGTNCIDSSAFVSCCQSLGAPSAFCWG